MDEGDRRIRNRTYELFVEHGRAPAPDDVGPGAREAWALLHEQHALVLDADGNLRMLNPFSVAPTPYLVEAAGRSWYANCAEAPFTAPHQDARAAPARPSALASSSVSNSSRTNSSIRTSEAHGGLRPHLGRRRKRRLGEAR